MRELLPFVAGLFGISVGALLFLGVCAVGLIAVVWLLWPRPQRTIRYRARGVVVHRDYTKARWEQGYVPGPPMLPLPLPGMEFLWLIPGPPILTSQYIPAQPCLCIEVEGLRVWIACNQQAYDRWPRNAAVLVEYELGKGGSINIVEFWLEQS